MNVGFDKLVFNLLKNLLKLFFFQNKNKIMFKNFNFAQIWSFNEKR